MTLLCECGCGMEVKEGRRFKRGHNSKGIPLSDEHKKKLSEAKKGKWSGENNPFYGKHHSEEAKRKMSKALSSENNPNWGKPMSDEQKKKISEGNKGKHHSEEAKRKMSKVRKGKQTGKKNPFYGKHHSMETKLKLSEAKKGKFTGSDNPFFGRRHSKETREKLRERRKMVKIPRYHTKPELKFEEICQRHDVDFHYVGDGQLWIGKKNEKKLNPDFIEANGKKICVEIFGDYWHSPLLNSDLREDRTLNYRRRFYRQYKWHPIFLWASDIMRPEGEEFVLSVLRREEVIK